MFLYLRDEFESKADELRAKQMEPIPYEKGAAMAKKINAYAYIEVSARKAKNLTECFDTCVRAALNAQQSQTQQSQTQQEGACCRI